MSTQPNDITPSLLGDLFDAISWNAHILLPSEIRDQITSEVMDTPPAKTNASPPQLPPSPALTPPANGACPIMDVPSELRRKFFAWALPNVTYKPSCKDDRVKWQFTSKHHPDVPPRHNAISDLMVVNKKISAEITEIVYEERFFVIHVHEGLRDGGIEFLDAGRQPLQYKDELTDPRFDRFGDKDKFGFRSLKKIIVQIHPSQEKFRVHVAMNTYFMNLALCHLLDRGGDQKHRITSIQIQFPRYKSKESSEAVGRPAIQRAEQYWWDERLQKPYESSIYGVSDIELVLRPFTILTGCHSVHIELPEYLRDHRPTVDFVARLEESMRSTRVTLSTPGELEFNIECARAALEDWVFSVIHGKGSKDIPKLTEEDFAADYLYPDSYSPNSRKRALPLWERDEGGDRKRKFDWQGFADRKMEDWEVFGEEEDLDHLWDPEQMQAAIAASLVDSSDNKSSVKAPQPKLNPNALPFRPQRLGSGFNDGPVKQSSVNAWDAFGGHNPAKSMVLTSTGGNRSWICVPRTSSSNIVGLETHGQTIDLTGDTPRILSTVPARRHREVIDLEEESDGGDEAHPVPSTPTSSTTSLLRSLRLRNLTERHGSKVTGETAKAKSDEGEG